MLHASTGAVLTCLAVLTYSTSCEARVPRFAEGTALRKSHYTPGDMLAEARKFVGAGNVSGYRGPWCGAFLAFLARRTGHRVPAGFLRASEWVKAGHRVSHPQIGAIAVLRHHVGIVAGLQGGRVILVSGNHRRHVGLGGYDPHRIIAYVRPA